MLGIHWDNTNDANIAAAMREEKEVFGSWLQSQTTSSMHHFEGSRWYHLKAMEELFLDNQACGSWAYHLTSRPAITHGSTAPGSSSIPTTSGSPSISAPPSHFGSYYGTSTISSGPWVGSPSGTLIDTMLNEGTVEKMFPTDIVAQPQVLIPHVHSPHSLMPPPPPPVILCNSPVPLTTSSLPSRRKCALTTGLAADSGLPMGEQGMSAEAALQMLSLRDDGEWSSKRAKGNDQSTVALLVGVQGSLTYLRSVISSSSAVTAKQRHTEKIQAALATVEEHDWDLPIEVKLALMEAFCIDTGVIDIYLSSHNKDLCRC
ncbi:hypothetical protein EDD16DRAFT_1710669 [Pisolithus croceorrhizus]|nr:hypothetical protein EV401DRAFT_2079413 [Pisolithus croceorrhizus]KAI6110675.1 hypothetical protein EDD16DRAFT_1710669 [Pisolithus croceorrhizus]KAI6159851.1 hypothetical protein EDD17DRAFT_1761907 [Pisolithus thermaeus]